ncbi:hypothetical protein [uncultured Psychrobacillus sp.]|uniref:hypothetical protein n=1 Tax=uncultured Psychrobacillus sp. TaxID=1551585 RepID=UPI002639EA25|nr:hypothetical protein [uncultured Psychrobacillus sp.]
MKVKFLNLRLWIAVGSGWLLVGILMFVLLIYFLQNDIVRGFGLWISPILLLIMIASAMLTGFYYRISRKNYLIIDDSSISVYRGPILSRQTINTLDINEVYTNERQIIIYLNDRKKIKLGKSFMSANEASQIEKMLKKTVNKSKNHLTQK